MTARMEDCFEIPISAEYSDTSPFNTTPQINIKSTQSHLYALRLLPVWVFCWFSPADIAAKHQNPRKKRDCDNDSTLSTEKRNKVHRHEKQSTTYLNRMEASSSCHHRQRGSHCLTTNISAFFYFSSPVCKATAVVE